MTEIFAVPACTRCSTRKIKCDRAAPSCSACAKTGGDCMIEDRSRKTSYTRQHIQELIEEIQRLEAQQGPQESRDEPATSGPSENAVESHSSSQQIRNQRFVGDSSSVSFLRYVFESSHWKPAQDELSRLLGQQYALPKQPQTPHEWPTFEESQLLVNAYLRSPHILHPFLHPARLLETLHNVYSIQNLDASPHQAHLLFMVFAIASVRTFRNGVTQHHPYGYFLAAQKYLAHIPLLGSLEGVQSLLLIARFGIYHDIGTSLWGLSQICMRQCVDLGLHRPSTSQTSTEDEQLQRCIFWSCYLDERYSSTTLGRPFALADQEISVALPWEVSYEELHLHNKGESLEDHIRVRRSGHPCDLSIFLFLVGLRQIQSANRISQVKHDYTGRNGSHLSTTMPGLLVCKAQASLSELDGWLLNAPQFPNPTSQYHFPGWYAFLVEKEKLSVLRAVLTRLSHFDAPAPKHIIKACCLAALKVIENFAEMFESKLILPTRGYFEALFVAGMSLMHCNTLEPSVLKLGHSSAQSKYEFSTALSRCSQNLLLLSHELPDSQSYYLIFDTLCRKFNQDQAAFDAHTSSALEGIVDVARTDGISMLPATLASSMAAERMGSLADPAACTVLHSSSNRGDPGSEAPHSDLTGVDPNSCETMDWNAFLSEEHMDQLVAEIETYVWDQPSGIQMPTLAPQLLSFPGS